MIPAPMAARQELEEAWRSKLEEARCRYSAATEEYRKLLEETPEGLRPNPDSALARARHAESEALAEYSRLLRVFTELTIHGKLPEQQSAASLIAVIDDDEAIRESVEALLMSAGHRVATFASAEAFLESGAATETGCLILDVRMPGMDGPALQVRLSYGKPRLPIIFITGHDDGPVRQRVIHAGAVDLLRKPFAPNTLLSTVQKALGRGVQP